jgi:hypothetical protein
MEISSSDSMRSAACNGVGCGLDFAIKIYAGITARHGVYCFLKLASIAMIHVSIIENA